MDYLWTFSLFSMAMIATGTAEENYGIQVKFSETGFKKVLSPTTETMTDTIPRIAIENRHAKMSFGNTEYFYSLERARMTSIGTIRSDIDFVVLSDQSFGANTTYTVDNIGLFFSFSLSVEGQDPIASKEGVSVDVSDVQVLFTLVQGNSRKATLVVSECSVDFGKALVTVKNSLIVQMLLNKIIESERSVLINTLTATLCPRLTTEVERRVKQYVVIADDVKPRACGQNLVLSYMLDEVQIDDESVKYNGKAHLAPKRVDVRQQKSPMFYHEQNRQDVQIIFTQPILSQLLQNWSSCDNVFTHALTEVSDSGVTVMMNSSSSEVDVSSHGISVTLAVRVELVRGGNEQDKIITFDLKLQRYLRIRYSGEKITFVMDSWVMDQLVDKSQKEIDDNGLCGIITSYGKGVIKSADDAVYEIPLTDFVKGHGLTDVSVSLPDGNLIINADLTEESSTTMKELRIANNVYSNKIVIGDRLEKSVQTCGASNAYFASVFYIMTLVQLTVFQF